MAFKSEETRKLNQMRGRETMRRKREEAKAAEWQRMIADWNKAVAERAADTRESAYG